MNGNITEMWDMSYKELESLYKDVDAQVKEFKAKGDKVLSEYYNRMLNHIISLMHIRRRE